MSLRSPGLVRVGLRRAGSSSSGGGATLPEAGQTAADFSAAIAALVTGAGEQILRQWSWDTAEIESSLANLIPSLQLIANSSDGLGTFRLRLGGDAFVPTNGTIIITAQTAPASATVMSVTGASFAKPAGGATILKLTGTPAGAAETVSASAIHCRIRGTT